MSRQFEGKTVEEALEEARREFGRELEEGEYRLVEDKRGFLGMARRVLVEVIDPADGTRSPEGEGEATSPARGSEAPGGTKVSLVEGLAAFEEALNEMIQGVGLDLRFSTSESEGRLRAEFEGPDVREMTAENGELLAAMQYLAQKVVSRRAPEGLRVEIDAGGFRERRDEELQELARRTAEAVHRTGRRALLPPLLPAERRRIHMALADDPNVVTESEGDGLKKRVAVLPRSSD